MTDSTRSTDELPRHDGLAPPPGRRSSGPASRACAPAPAQGAFRVPRAARDPEAIADYLQRCCPVRPTARDLHRIARLLDSDPLYTRLLWLLWSRGLLPSGDPRLRALVPCAWCATRHPMDCLSAAQWRALFRAATPVRRWTACPLAVFRAAMPGFERRWSWTDDLAVARAYRDRYARGRGGTRWTGAPVRIYRAVAPPEAVLWHMGVDARAGSPFALSLAFDSHEVVVETRGLPIQAFEDARGRRAGPADRVLERLR